MDNTPCRNFFLQPAEASQRLYEAFRAVFVAGERQRDVAERFGFSFAAFRQQVVLFRRACSAGQPPPFSFLDGAADPSIPQALQGNLNSQPWPIAGS
jgi:hypothetical protein